jgi:MoaA/NifB/PqqE/SkfB family radical SAM enzyme
MDEEIASWQPCTQDKDSNLPEIVIKPNVEVWFELETKCNLGCKFCFNYWKSGTEIAPRILSTTETLKGLKTLLDAVHCSCLTIAGGEPLLRKDIFVILEFVSSYHIPMVLATNGLLLNREMIGHLVGLGVVTFQIPIHSADQAIHNFLSGKQCWGETLRALVLAKESGVNVIPVFVATKKNMGHLNSVMELCSQIRIEEIIFNRFVPTGAGALNRDEVGVPTDNELVPVLISANEKAKHLNTKITLGNPINIPVEILRTLDRVEAASCLVAFGQKRWTLDAEGNLRRCNQSSKSIGNLFHDGVETLLEELGRLSCNETFHSCQFISGNGGADVPVVTVHHEFSTESLASG